MTISNRIYLDHAASTPALPEVVAVMNEYLLNTFGNPSSLHHFGQEARKAIDDARDTIASALGAVPAEIYFTSGGTESNNLALIGTATALFKRGKHIITTAVEHDAVLKPCIFLAENGFEITYLPVDKHGLVDPADLRRSITSKTVLVSIMHANNEVGTIEPIEECSAITREAGIPFHTDAIQSAGHIPVGVNALGVDMLSIAGHKFGGPKGVGALFVRRGTRINSLIHGGAQERERRAGTENVPGIMGMAKALEIAVGEMDEQAKIESELKDQLIRGLMEELPDAILNGHPTRRLPGNVNISIPGVEGESLLLNLDMQGIAVSSGSACSSGAIQPSHVLRAMGLPFTLAQAGIRLSLGRSNTPEQIERVINVLPAIVTKLRSASPTVD